MQVRPVVFVHLDHGRGEASWAAAHRAGRVLEPTPYGYRTVDAEVEMSMSSDHRESRIVRFIRRGLAHVIGFDVVHAVRNRRGLAAADVIWTHTEHEHLAVALLMKARLIPRRPIIGQSIWLWDRWERTSTPRRWFYRGLLREIALHTTHSPINAEVARRVVTQPVVVVPFGIEPVIVDLPRSTRRLVVVAPGNDRDRDWPLLAELAARHPDIVVRIVSRRRAATSVLRRGLPNLEAAPTLHRDEYAALLAAADVLVVPVRENMHASGITVALEGIVAGRAVVATSTGGLPAYLGASVRFVPVGDVEALAIAVRAAAAAPEEELLSARRGVESNGLLIRDYAKRHVLLTRALLAGEEPPPEASAFAPVRLD